MKESIGDLDSNKYNQNRTDTLTFHEILLILQSANQSIQITTIHLKSLLPHDQHIFIQIILDEIKIIEDHLIQIQLNNNDSQK